jgi:hypothetical protein
MNRARSEDREVDPKALAKIESCAGSHLAQALGNARLAGQVVAG